MKNKEIEELLDILIKKLDKNVNEYDGNYGTLEARVGETFYQILNILKVMNDDNPFSQWYLDELMKGDE